MTQLATRPTSGNGIAKQEAKPLSIRDRLDGDDFKHAVARVLPKHLTADRFVRVAILATTRTPKLLECDQASLFNALMTLSQYGLEPDGRRAHLIPFKKNFKGADGQWRDRLECQLIIDYKGLAELVMRSGLVSYIHADVIREGDIFEFNTGEIVRHVPWFLRRDAEKPEQAGERFAAYALVKMKDGTSKSEVMSADDILAIRNKSQGWMAFEKGWSKSTPWDPKDEGIESEMWKKTAFRRLSKWLPLSPELQGAVEADDEDTTPREAVKAAEAANSRLAAARFAMETAGDTEDVENDPKFVDQPATVASEPTAAAPQPEQPKPANGSGRPRARKADQPLAEEATAKAEERPAEAPADAAPVASAPTEAEAWADNVIAGGAAAVKKAIAAMHPRILQETKAELELEGVDRTPEQTRAMLIRYHEKAPKP